MNEAECIAKMITLIVRYATGQTKKVSSAKELLNMMTVNATR